MSEADYLTTERTIAQLRGAGDKYLETTGSPQCDKKDIGFNKDSRFKTFDMRLSFDSWHGYFGDSGCSTVISFADNNLVKTGLVRYLNRHWRSIFEEIADDLEKDNEAVKAKHIAELEAELERLRS